MTVPFVFHHFFHVSLVFSFLSIALALLTIDTVTQEEETEFGGLRSTQCSMESV